MMEEPQHGMVVNADRWNPRICWRTEEDVQGTSRRKTINRNGIDEGREDVLYP